MGRRKGVTVTDTPKDSVIRARIDEDTRRKIAVIQSATGKKISDIIREGVDKLYAEIKK